MSDTVNHPTHYTNHPSGVECIQITEHMDFLLGNALKYIWRAGEKGDIVEDLEKARWYLNRKLDLIKRQRSESPADAEPEKGFTKVVESFIDAAARTKRAFDPKPGMLVMGTGSRSGQMYYGRLDSAAVAKRWGAKDNESLLWAGNNGGYVFVETDSMVALQP